MALANNSSAKSVAIVGGGLAGLAAAVALCQRELRVALFESRRQPGGRAGSFVDPASGQPVDHCQHVSMGCCTNLADFCRRTGIAELFERHRTLYFFGPDGCRCDFRATPGLPAPLHLATSLLRMSYLSWGERISIGRCMLQLARSGASDSRGNATTIGSWLRRQGQSQRAIDRFWSVVLVSALGETVDRASLAAARKVFFDGFLTNRAAYHIEVPKVPLGELYAKRVVDWLRDQGVALHLGRSVKSVTGDPSRATGITLDDGSEQAFDFLVVAVPWRRAGELMSQQLRAALPEVEAFDRFRAAPITAVHLWFDRAITPLPHAVLVDRLSQWMFNRGERPWPDVEDSTAHYYQVVISASRELSGRSREEVRDEVVGDLQAVWPAARQAELLQWRMVTQPEAVFSLTPAIENLRPRQQSSIENLFWAGDWTSTGWPATMEGAVRSGYLAAEALLRRQGEEAQLLVDELPQGWLSRLLCGKR